MELIFKEIKNNYPLSLLLLADPDIKKIEKYLNKGQCFVAYVSDEVVGVYVLKDQKEGRAEIMNLAVSEKHQRQGVGKSLILNAIEQAKSQKFQILEIATGKDSFQHRFYEACGFCVFEIDEGYFPRTYPQPIIENGLEYKDLARLRLPL